MRVTRAGGLLDLLLAGVAVDELEVVFVLVPGLVLDGLLAWLVPPGAEVLDLVLLDDLLGEVLLALVRPQLLLLQLLAEVVLVLSRLSYLSSP